MRAATQDDALETMRFAPRCFAIVPAGGVGSRLGGPLPKQYLPVAGQPIIRWAIAPLLAADWIVTTVLVVAADDQQVEAALSGLMGAADRLRVAPVGGASRRDSVLNGLRWLDDHVQPDPRDFILVHDAARPGLTLALLNRLRDSLLDHPVGGLLAMPVVDTVKRADDKGQVQATIARQGLWLAQTPQMFRFGPLLAALDLHPSVTDEAAAIEAQGLSPALIEGAHDNFKVTGPSDLQRMEWCLSQRPRPDGSF